MQGLYFKHTEFNFSKRITPTLTQKRPGPTILIFRCYIVMLYMGSYFYTHFPRHCFLQRVSKFTKKPTFPWGSRAIFVPLGKPFKDAGQQSAKMKQRNRGEFFTDSWTHPKLRGLGIFLFEAQLLFFSNKKTDSIFKRSNWEGRFATSTRWNNKKTHKNIQKYPASSYTSRGVNYTFA